MIVRILMILTGIALAYPAHGQVRPTPGTGNAHLQTVAYMPDQVVQLEVTPGYQLMIIFAPDEVIETVAVGDSSAWQVSANNAGRMLFVKPQQYGASTNMTVLTNARIYTFDLATGYGEPSAYTVRFTYPAVPPSPGIEADTIVGRYRLSGTRTLRPSAIGDDGQRTLIEWPQNSALPAVYAVDEEGRETLANGSMRDGVLVIDGVAPRLLFRIDKDVARATRRAVKQER